MSQHATNNLPANSLSWSYEIFSVTPAGLATSSPLQHLLHVASGVPHLPAFPSFVGPSPVSFASFLPSLHYL